MKKWVWLAAVPAIILFWQNCGNVKLEELDEISFLSLSATPFQLAPPLDYEQPRRIIFFVDMSQSMISGPCYQDVDANIGFAPSPTYVDFDPNKETGDPDDHRGSGVDCKVNPDLPIARSSIFNARPRLLADPPIFYETHLGMDHEAYRLDLVRNWIIQAQSNPTAVVRNTKIMLVPVSGGLSQKQLNEKWIKVAGESNPLSFIPVTDPKLLLLLDWMKQEQNENLELSKSDDEWRYEKRTMGTTSPGSLLRGLYQSVYLEMEALNKEGKLFSSQFQFMHITDGLITPVQKNITDVLTMYGTCGSCLADTKTCTGTCGALTKRMTDAWGLGTDNDLSKIDFYLGLIQTLPYYFGSGFLRLDFVQLKGDRLTSAYPGEESYFEKLKPLFKARSARMSVWHSDDAQPPFRLVGDATQSSSYQVTHLYILNANARVNRQGVLKADSDGDGLFDDEESAAGTSPTLPRSNNYCLDSLFADPAFAERCRVMASARTCDPTLDSDSDGLNECEESLLGTNPFDFDTDNDGLPDSLEWIYGYNPLVSDSAADSNGDGYLNSINFASGLGPEQFIKQLSPDLLVKYETNSQGKKTISLPTRPQIQIELYELIVHNVPAIQGITIDPNSLPVKYLSRVGNDKAAQAANLIPYSQQILSVIDSPNRNTMIALARMVDVANPERIYWRFYKTSIHTSNNFVQPVLDLSLFSLLKANDRVE